MTSWISVERTFNVFFKDCSGSKKVAIPAGSRQSAKARLRRTYGNVEIIGVELMMPALHA